MNPPPAQVDVTVVGGGSAGLAAALAAARQGARTLLIERHGRLGGMGTVANVHTFCGLFHPDTSLPPQWLNPGIPEEIGRQMMQRTGTQPELMGQVYVLRQHPATFSQLAAELCAQEPLLTVLTHASLIAHHYQDNRWQLIVDVNNAPTPVISATLVDTTGAASLAPAQTLQSNDGVRLHRPAFIAQLTHLSGPLTEDARLQLAGNIVRAVQAGSLSTLLLGASFRPSTSPAEAFVTLDLEAGGLEWNPSDPAFVTSAYSTAKEAIAQLWKHLHATDPIFAQSPEPQWPETLGIRETARLQGDYLLTADDLLQSRRFPDEVALAGWPLEMRETARGPKMRYFAQPQPAGIPARCLHTTAQPNLWFAGRCLSADHEALSSVRVMGTCLATGQAAGRLAAHMAL